MGRKRLKDWIMLAEFVLKRRGESIERTLTFFSTIDAPVPWRAEVHVLVTVSAAAP